MLECLIWPYGSMHLAPATIVMLCTVLAASYRRNMYTPDRTWSARPHTNGQHVHTAQAEGTAAAAGVYNETAFRGLDYILHQASLSGVRVLFTLADNWKTQDSKMNVRR